MPACEQHDWAVQRLNPLISQHEEDMPEVGVLELMLGGCRSAQSATDGNADQTVDTGSRVNKRWLYGVRIVTVTAATLKTRSRQPRWLVIRSLANDHSQGARQSANRLDDR